MSYDPHESFQVRSGYASFTGEKLRSLREKIEELTQAFQIEEEPEGIARFSFKVHLSICYPQPPKYWMMTAVSYLK